MIAAEEGADGAETTPERLSCVRPARSRLDTALSKLQFE